MRTALFFLLVLLAAPVWPQEAAAYVSRLTAQAGPQSVLLTWKDADGFPGAKYEVWRSEKEIVKDSLSQAKLVATVNAGVEAFEDTSVTAAAFYLVLLKDSNGVRRGYYIPYRNKTTEPVKPSGLASSATARVRVGTVTYANPQILVAFQAFPPDRKLLVFRRASAIKSLADLRDSTSLGNTTGTQSPYRDTPPPGLEFYYAVVDAQAWSDGKADAFQPENATDKPVGFPLVALSPDAKDTSLDSALRPDLASTRALPLPRLQVGSEPDSGAPMASSAYEPVASRALPPEADAVLKRWSRASVADAALPGLKVLPEERSAAQDGAGRYLVQILKAYIDPKDWKGAVTALESVLKLTLDDRTRARAQFYLGEAWANLKDYRRAFVEFLAARDAYPAETKPNLEALFSLLESDPN
jgi:hypothetical protein